MSPQVLERFHRALVEEIQIQRPEYLTSRFTVAEIYQNLVPYGSHRDRIGVEMNGDYEDALIRLLAGEGGFLMLESEPALRDLKAELGSTNPNTGVYREFAAVDVRLNPAFLNDLADVAPQGSGTPGFEVSPLGIIPPGMDIFADQYDAEAAAGAPAGSGAESFDTTGQQPRPPLDPEFVPAPEPTSEPGLPPRPGQLDLLAHGSSACPSCRGALPDREKLNFCPFCGTDLSILLCAACKEEIEAGWRFCASCGQETGV